MKPQARRGIAAVLLAMFLAAGTLGVIGIAAAGDDAPAAFGVPEPRIGDLVKVVHVRASGTAAPDPSSDFGVHSRALFDKYNGSLALGPIERWRDGDGTYRDVLPARYTMSQSDLNWTFNRTHLIDPETRLPIGLRDDGSSSWASEWDGLGVVPQGTTSSWAMSTDVFAAGELMCGLFSPLQGAAIDLSGGVLFPGCDDTFRYDGMETIDGIETIRLVGERHRLWYAPHVPYPIHAEKTVPSGWHIAWITGFSPGDEPIPAARAPDEAPLPQAALGPATGLGPAGLDVPFSLEEAWEILRETDEATTFRMNHPDAYIVEATSFRGETNTSTSFGWTVVLGEDEQTLVMDVTRTWDRPLRGLPGPLALEQSVGEPHDRIGDPYEGSLWLQRYPPAGLIPKALPSAESVAAIFAAYAGGAEADVYGFRFWCDDACTTAEGVVLAGKGRLTEEGLPVLLPGQSTSVSADSTYFSVTLAGRPWSFARLGSEEVRESHGPLDPVAAGESFDGASESLTLAAGIPWQPPTKEAAAGITFAAVLVAFFYWLWPWLKALPLAGFSRLQRHKLLEHPVRASLMERIEAEPGIHYQDLVRAEGKGKGAIEHHLRHLESAALVTVDRGSGRACYFPKGTDRRVVASTVALKSEGTAAVLAAIKAAPGCNAKEAARRSALSPATVSHHLHKLQEAGLVQAKRGPRGALALYAA